MAFQISSHGSRAGVTKFVQAAKPTPETADGKQLEAVKLLIVSEIEAIAPEFNGVRVEASGDSHAGQRSCQINVMPLKLHLD